MQIDHLRTLDDEPWQPVSPRYASQLRIYLLVYGLIFSVIPWFFRTVDGAAREWVGPVSIAVALLFIALIIFWVPRRVRHTRYLLRTLDMHMQTGLLWRRTTSVAINRVQHMELSQGPLERSLGLSRLVLYTAGGMKSDLVLPGLPTDTAQRLKAKILSGPDDAQGPARRDVESAAEGGDDESGQ